MLAGQAALAVVIIAVVAMLQDRRNERLADLGLRRPPHGWARTLVLGAGLGVAIKAATIPVGLVAVGLGAKPGKLSFDLESGVELLAFVLAGAIAALVEEIVFRGYLRDRIARVSRWDRTSWTIGILTSVVFGLGHGSQGSLGIVTTFFVGVLFFAVVRSPRLTLTHAIIAHATFNSIAFFYIGAANR